MQLSHYGKRVCPLDIMLDFPIG